MRNTKNMFKKLLLTMAFCVMATLLTFAPTADGENKTVSVEAASASITTSTAGQLRIGGTTTIKINAAASIKSVKVSTSNDNTKVKSITVNSSNSKKATVKIKGLSKGSSTAYVKVYFKDGSTYSKSLSLQVYDLSKWNSVYKQLKKMGYSKNEALGIMASLMWETGPVYAGNYNSFGLSTLANNFINPTSNTGRYYGIFQLAGSRKSSLFSYCSRNGLSSSKVSSQLYFMNYEMHHSEYSAYKKLKATDSAYSAGYSFAANYERCGYAYSMRAATAQRLDLFW